MADVNVFSFTEGSNEYLLSVYGNDVSIYNTGTEVWDGQSQNLIPGTWKGAKHKAHFYLVSQDDNPRILDANGNWSETKNMTNAPRATYPFGDFGRLFLGNCYFNNLSRYFRRRVFYSDITTDDENVVWGLESGTDLSQTADGFKVTSASATFLTSNIKIGDVFLILGGQNIGEYAVVDVLSETEIRLDKPLQYTASSTKYIVGSNFFDLDDDVTALNHHYGVLLAFDYNKAYRWAPSIGLKEVMGVKGTNSHESVIRKLGYTFWYHPEAGLIRFSGNTADIVSEGIQPYLDGISATQKPVAWEGHGRYKNHIYWYVGDITNDDYDISMSNVVIDYNIRRNRFKFHEFDGNIVSATTHKTDDIYTTYMGTDSDVVLTNSTGYTDYDISADDGSTVDIELYGETHPIYPAGVSVMLMFDQLNAYMEYGTGLQFKYKIKGNPEDVDEDWSELFEINDQYYQMSFGPEDKGRGLCVKFTEISDSDVGFNGIDFLYRVIDRIT